MVLQKRQLAIQHTVSLLISKSHKVLLKISVFLRPLVNFFPLNLSTNLFIQINSVAIMIEKRKRKLQALNPTYNLQIKLAKSLEHFDLLQLCMCSTNFDADATGSAETLFSS